MKAIFTNILFLAIYCSSLNFSAQVKLGITTGISNSRFHGSNSESRIRIHNPFAKLSGQFNLNTHWSAELAMAYMALGGRIDEERRPNYLSSHKLFNLDYIHGESNLEYRPWRKFYMQIGVYAGYLTRVQAQGFDEVGNRISSVQTLHPDVQSWDYGYNAGLGFTSNNGIRVGMRFFLGLAPVLSVGNSEFVNTLSTFSFTYWIPLKKTNDS